MPNGLPPRIADYEPLELLAVGGMARVVVARREGGEERVALKLILPHLAKDEEYTTMFLDEARINARVVHPNVVAVHGTGRDPVTQILYLAMELVLGATLSQVLRAYEDGLDWRVALDVIAQAAEGLAAAHEATDEHGAPLEIIHRDVSPANLLIGLDARVRVGDFGVARAAHRATRTKTGQFKGKLAYCSPEHALGQPVDARTDIFSLGVVAFEALTRTRLFARSTPFATISAIAEEPIPSLGSAGVAVPPEAVELVDAMLAREIEGRPSTAREVAERLRGIVGDLDPERVALKRAVERAASPQVLRLAGRRVIVTDSGTRIAAPEAVTRVEGPKAEVPDDATVIDDREA